MKGKKQGSAKSCSIRGVTARRLGRWNRKREGTTDIEGCREEGEPRRITHLTTQFKGGI